MATSHLPGAAAHGVLFVGARLLAVPLIALLVAVVLPPGGRATARNPALADVVASVTAAYGAVGTLAVVVAKQQLPAVDSAIVPADARRARIAAATADNGLADRPFPAASMVKLFMAEDVLHRARSGELSLTREDFARLQVMIRSSDDPAASTVWVRHGGGQMVTAVVARYRLTGTAPPVDPGQWGSTTTTARDLARFLSLLPVVAHPADAGALLTWMRTATPMAADGFDQRFGLHGTVPGLPAVKQGWMCCVGGKRHLHSVGVIGRRVVVLLSEVPRSTGYDAGRAALAAAAAALPPPRP